MRRKLTTRTVNSLASTGKRFRVWDTEISGFNLRVSPKGTKQYVLTYRHHGTQREYTIGQHGKITTDIARKIAKKLGGKIADNRDIQSEKINAIKQEKSTKYSTLIKFVDNKYKPWVQTNQKGHKEALRVIAVDYEHLHSRKLAEITQWDIQKWIAKAIKRNLEPTTINRRVATLKSVLTKAVEWQVIEISQLAGMKQLKTDNRIRVRYLDPHEDVEFRNALNFRQEKQRNERKQYITWCQSRNRDTPCELTSPFTDHLKPIVLLAINTGMRRGEIFSLKWIDIDFTGKNVTITGKTAKSGNTRYVPLNDEALATLLAWRNQSTSKALVFPSPTTGRRMDNIASSWKSLIDKASLKNFRFHDLRHHFASQLVMAGIDLNTVRELLGHKDIDTTLRYAHLAPEHKAAAVAVLNRKSVNK